MKYIIKRNTSKPFIHFKENLVVNVSNEFEILTGFLKEELLGKTISELNILLKILSQVKLENIDVEYNCYIFSKMDEPREVKILCERFIEINEEVYSFKEKRNSRIDENYPYISKILPDGDIAVAVYSVPNGILLKANKKYVSYLDDLCCNNSNKIGKSLNEFIPNYKGSMYEYDFITVCNNGIPMYFKDHNDYSYQEGEKFWDGSLIPVYKQGKMKYIFHNGIDVTERVLSRKIIEKQKEELEEQRQELEAIIENMSDEVIIFDESGNFKKLNKLTRDNALYDVNKIKNIESFADLGILYDMDGNLIPLENTLTYRVIKGEKINNIQIMKKNNIIQYREVSGTPIYDSEGNFKLGVLISRDICERLKNEENIFIKAQYETLYRIIKNLDLGFGRITYPDFKLIDINNKAFGILKKIIPEIEFRSIYNKKLSDIIKKDINIKEYIISTMNTHMNSCYIIKKYDFDGEEVFYKYIFQPLYDLNNEILEVIIIILDITEDEKSKNKMEEAIKIQDELYMNVSHELRTPLNVIFSANQIMDIFLKSKSTELDKEKLVGYNNIVKQNCYRLTKLINNIIDLSKSKTGFLKINVCNENIVDIVKNIVQSVSEYAKSKNIKISFESNIKEKFIACDSFMIERVMLNLLSNSIKFSNPNSDINVSVINNHTTVSINVKDIGIGMDESTLICLFEKYYQADKSLSRMAEGSGIGLSLVKSIVELHGGNIKVDSELGKGSTFIVELPATKVNFKCINKEYNNDNRIELINIEFSDIYSNE